MPHVHYHIIPRGTRPEIMARSWAMFGKGQRTDLDEEDAAVLAPQIRDEIQKELAVMADKDPHARRLLGKL